MYWDAIKGNLRQVASSIRTKWCDLTQGGPQRVKGDAKVLADQVHGRAGIAKDKAQRQVDAFVVEQKTKF
ncbi:CsbD family protein [Tateyamaria sp.]